MKSNFFIIFYIFFFTSCSLDNKSGIWKSEDTSSQKISKDFDEFKKLNSANNNFNKIVLLDKNFKFKLTKATENENGQIFFLVKIII